MPRRPNRRTALEEGNRQKASTTLQPQAIPLSTLESFSSPPPRNRVLALDLETGETVWQVENVKAGYCSAALWGDLLLLTALDGNIYALDSKTGAMKWQSKAGEGIYDARVAVDGRLGITNTCWGSLAAFDLETGEPQVEGEARRPPLFSALPMLTGGVVYVGSTNDHIYAVKHK